MVALFVNVVDDEIGPEIDDSYPKNPGCKIKAW
jgi:hypothetical protein